ncbi:MAG: hypothetical protein IJ458_00745 [Clostridia bacterium]|nr:hypothetical protein [Clostridia bacterium]
MFFNYCCKRPCCRCKYDKQEKNGCDIKDRCDYDRCDKRDDNHNKCEYEKKEKCCCHINVEKKCCCDKNDDKRFTKNDNYYQGNRDFDYKSYYDEYNNLGYFGNNDKEYDYEQNNRKSYSKEDNRNSYSNENNRKSYDDDNDFDYKSYTPNWENDRECKCEKDKHDKCDKNNWDNKCCKPVKYICIPFDKF